MKCAEKPLEYSVTNTESRKMPVIIVAAGNSTRMQGVNKQFLPVGKIPVIVRTALAFENCDCISDIIIVCRETDILNIERLFNEYNISKLTDIVVGGKTRQESVYNGFAVLNKSDKFVLIHDGARPLVSNEVIYGVVTAPDEFFSVAPAVKVKDTVKEVENSISGKTADRSKLFSVQTPQRVHIEKYREIINNSKDRQFTDDTSVMESGGYKTLITLGEYKNIKITTSEDVIIAEALIESEKKL